MGRRRRIKERWLRLSGEENALDYLEHAYQHILRTEKCAIAWKWVAIALHGALYGFAVYACKGTNPENVTYKHKKGVEKVISFDEALRRCQDARVMRMTTMSKQLSLSTTQKDALEMVKDLFATPRAGQEIDVSVFANDVQTVQTAEIGTMQKMLSNL